ncbi:MAG: hypothetical protein ACJAQT_003594 [Akkermansiaceae bacterium]
MGIKFKQTARFFSLDSREHSRRLHRSEERLRR